jgi:hypothetical protein
VLSPRNAARPRLVQPFDVIQHPNPVPPAETDDVPPAEMSVAGTVDANPAIDAARSSPKTSSRG